MRLRPRLEAPNNGQWTNGGGSLSTAAKSLVVGAVTGGNILFQADFSVSTYSAFAAQFNEINTYAGVDIDYVTGLNHAGTGPGHNCFRISYPADEAGVECKMPPWAASPEIYIRQREYYAGPNFNGRSNAGWAGNWPVGLKTGRFFTRSDFSSNPIGNTTQGWAYTSLKHIWQGYPDSDAFGTIDDTYCRGWGSANYINDKAQAYTSGQLFANGLPYIRQGYWYCVETRMKLNSAADVADGEFEVRIDGVVVYNNTAMVWVSNSPSRAEPPDTPPPNQGTDGWQSGWIGGNYSGAVFGSPTGTVDRYISEMFVSDYPDWQSF